MSLTLRVLAITIPTNVDEALWLYRGVTFIKHLFEGDFANTYIFHHPGVTNMWLIGSSQFLNSFLYSLFPDWLNLDQPPLQHVCFDKVYVPCPISLYVMPRLVQAVITSACMVGIYILAKRLLGRFIGLIFISLLIVSPFFLAYQRYITTDALQADFSILAVLLLLLYLRGDGKRQWLLASGMFMGLAIASKIPTIFILPAIIVWIVLIELGVWRTSFPQRGWIRQIFDLTIWGITATAIIFVIWPAFWVAPQETWTKLYEGLLREADRGTLFFWGKLTDSPGKLFYPLVLAYRLSPLLQVGLLVCLLTLLIPRLRHRLDKMPELAAIALIPVSVLFVLSNIHSKIDRYIILVLPELALLAGAGWLQLGIWVKSWRILKGVKTAIALAVVQLFFLVPRYPYYISYYNPLLGGAQAAKNLFMLGQGDGLDKAAHWLNQLPNAKEITAASWYSPAFGSYFQGRTLELQSFSPPNLIEINWINANYVVLYFNQLQRQLPEPKMLAYFAAQQPLYSVQMDNIDYVLVYPGPLPLPQDLEHIQFPLSVSFAKQVRLLGYDLNTSQLKSGDKLVVTYYWKFLESLPPDLTINTSLRDSNGKLLESSQSSLINDYLPLNQITPGTVVRDVHQLKTSTGIPTGRYQLEVGWFSTNKEQALEVENTQENLQGSPAVISSVDIVNF
ncbi:glycosyltransferase family 39 protein [Halotia wernerae UHCC 0503]|nr:glycosyltransferase family 39 protein [Halotia wernerae UHCC 0503]